MINKLFIGKAPRKRVIYQCPICKKNFIKGDLMVQIEVDEYAHPGHRGIENEKIYDGLFKCSGELKYREI